jgi:multimeric flavodoxin WrbA
MKALLVNGSPHTVRGVHVSILDTFEVGLRKAGSDVTRINVYRQNIQPCRGCFTCWTKTPGECIQEDDMKSLLPLVAQSDVLALATPVYVDGMTGPMKTFLDRLIPLLKGRVELRDDHIRHIMREDVKRGKVVLLSASGFAEMDNFDPLVAHVKAASRNLGREYAGEILFPGGWFLRGSEAMDEVSGMVRSAGVELVERGRIPGGLSSRIHELVSRDQVMDALNAHYGKFE